MVPDQEIAKAEAALRLPHPSKRTKQQHLFAAYLMRPRKAMMNPRRAKQQTEEQAGHAMALIRDSGVLLNRRAKKTPRSKASLALSAWIVADSTTINVAHMQQTRKADVAKTFDSDPSLVTLACTRGCCTCLLHQ